MAVINSLPLTSKFHNADSRRDGLLSKEDKKKIDSWQSSFSYAIIIEPIDWQETDTGLYTVSVEVPDLKEDMYAILIPHSSCTKVQFYEIAECELSVRNIGNNAIEITSVKLPEYTLPLTILYSANAVMVPIPEIYNEENTIKEFVLRSADWVGESAPYTQTIVFDGLNDTMYGAVSLADDYTGQELRAAILAKIQTTQDGNRITFSATEEKPTIDIRGYITYGNNVAMSFYPLANMDGLVEAKNVPIDNSNIGLEDSPKNVEEALVVIWDRLVRTTDGSFPTEKKLILKVGMCFFDTILGKPVWCKSMNPYVFVDAMGNEVYTV